MAWEVSLSENEDGETLLELKGFARRKESLSESHVLHLSRDDINYVTTNA
jgi:hypothetical protein